MRSSLAYCAVGLLVPVFLGTVGCQRHSAPKSAVATVPKGYQRYRGRAASGEAYSFALPARFAPSRSRTHDAYEFVSKSGETLTIALAPRAGAGTRELDRAALDSTSPTNKVELPGGARVLLRVDTLGGRGTRRNRAIGLWYSGDASGSVYIRSTLGPADLRSELFGVCESLSLDQAQGPSEEGPGTRELPAPDQVR